MATFKQIKDYLKDKPALHIQGVTERPTNNIKEFMELLFTEYFRKNDTLYGNNRVQTEAGKRRSISDIYKVMQYYFPSITLTTIYNNLHKLIAEDKIISAICSVLGIRVYRRAKNGEKGCVNSSFTDEFQIDLNPYIKEHGCNTQLPATWGTNYTDKHLKFIEI